MVMIEFLLLHSGTFMAVGSVLFSRAWQRLCWFLLFSLIYIAAIWGFTSWSDGSYVAWILAGVLGSRLVTLVILRDKKGTMMAFQRSAVGMFLLVVTAVVCFIPLPELGISEDIRQSAFGEAEDFLSSRPHRFIAWGIAYFFLMSLVEFFVGWRLPDWPDEQAEKGWQVLQK